MANEIALEEYRQLQAIIGRHEDHAFKVRGVMYALLTALAVPVFSHDRILAGRQFALLAAIIILLFLFVELVHRGFVRLAIERTDALETILRTQAPYDGPLITQSLGQRRLFAMMLREVGMPWVMVHYASLALVVIAIARFGL